MSGRRSSNCAGMPTTTSGRRRGNRPLAQPGLQVGGRDAQQRAKRVLALPQDDLEGRDRGLGLRERALCLVHVQFA